MFVLIRDSEVHKVYVYNNVTREAAEHLQFMFEESNSYGFFSWYMSDKPYDPTIAHQFLETGSVDEEHMACKTE